MLPFQIRTLARQFLFSFLPRATKKLLKKWAMCWTQMCFSGPYVMNILHTARTIGMESALFQLSSLYFSNTHLLPSFVGSRKKESKMQPSCLVVNVLIQNCKESPLKGRKGFYGNVEIAYQFMTRSKIIRIRSPSPFKTFKTFQEYSKMDLLEKGIGFLLLSPPYFFV